jgi:NAD(P)H-quinone oxidoreductase subunit 5
MRSFLTLILVAIPVLPLLAGILARLGGIPARTARWVSATAGMSALLAAAAAVALITGGPLIVHWTPLAAGSAWSLSLRLDAISAVMVVLVSYLGWTVLRFSRNYLAGDPGQTRFFSWMSLTLASVLAVVLSNHLLLISASWIMTSLCLHRLLLHYPGRAGAIFSARKKFVVSRLADICLLAAALLLYRNYGTWELDRLFAAVSSGQTGGLTLSGFLIVACAALKSAQFPFHSWLPDTMETPTPVSAFMHAGIINAGGFLVVRLSPLLVNAPAALNLLAILGALTAAFGAIVKLAQPSVKRALAYSTIAQMGFMMLQCGLGAYGLALLHIVAHSLYKAHAFLTAGSTIGAVPRAAIKLKTPALTLGVLGGALLVVGGATALQALAPSASLHLGVFALVLALALAYGLARAWSIGGGLRTGLRSVGIAAVIAAASLALHTGANALFTDLPAMSPSPAVLGAVTTIFVTLFIFQALLWRAAHYDLGRRLYVHALNGFYLGTFANRFLGLLWPRHPVS